MPWDPLDIRLGWTYQAQKNGVWRTIHAFGGLLTENVVMGIERDIMTHGAELLDANGFPIILDVHDELLCEPEAGNCDLKAMEQIMCDIEPWAKELKLPIAIEAWEGDRYRK
jgi:DNA polymerase